MTTTLTTLLELEPMPGPVADALEALLQPYLPAGVTVRSYDLPADDTAALVRFIQRQETL